MKALLQRYTTGMASHVATCAEASLLDIEELGRHAITEDFALDEIAGLHEGAALALADQGCRSTSRRSSGACRPASAR